MKRKRRDNVTTETAETVLRRDKQCVATILSPSESVNCWGRLTYDHIKDEPRMGRRAASDAGHLVLLCQGHMEDGRKAGYQWNTANRPILRKYLRQVQPSNDG